MTPCLSRRQCIPLIAIAWFLLAMPLVGHAQTSYEIRFESTAVKVAECEFAVKDWQRQAVVSGILLGIIAVFGGATAIIQGLQRPWTKTATVILGGVVTIVTVINTAAL